ncbi:hypothetical protein EV127DRAFT_196031 [Xylaria flabelliformis]|nr:hypothetical protein EV127DRAFT_196031 [Xylaria flabelliformis]
MPLKVLIIGAGVCGPALATMLRRADPDMEKYEEITVIERAPKLREGLQIDIRAQGISVMRKMGREFYFLSSYSYCSECEQRTREMWNRSYLNFLFASFISHS